MLHQTIKKYTCSIKNNLPYRVLEHGATLLTEGATVCSHILENVPAHLSISCDSYTQGSEYSDKPLHPTPIYLLKGCLHGCVISYIGLSK